MKEILSHRDVLNLKSAINAIKSDLNLLQNPDYQQSIYRVLRCLELGTLRVCSPKGLDANCGDVPMHSLETWEVHAWVKDAILFAMKLRKSQKVRTQTESVSSIDTDQNRIHLGQTVYHDKFDLQTRFDELNVRAVPGALVREGSYVGQDTIIMPSFVNIGAWVGSGTMVDTWATVGSCAQIGKDVHLAGGVGIGGVLEPVNARPILIGDKAFIGSRVILVEGVIVGEGAVIGANCCITLSTPIYDVTGSEKIEFRGIVPPHAVLVPGTRNRAFPGGEVPLSCCYIIDYRGEKQNEKIQLNSMLRNQSNESAELQ